MKNPVIKGHEVLTAVNCKFVQLLFSNLHPAAITCIVGGSIVKQS
jgi:hypothetical protein